MMLIGLFRKPNHFAVKQQLRVHPWHWVSGDIFHGFVAKETMINVFHFLLTSLSQMAVYTFGRLIR